MKRIRGILFGVMLVIFFTLLEKSFKEDDMSQRPMTLFLKLWVLAVLAVVLINMMASKAHGQEPHIVRAPLRDYAAITTCEQNNEVTIVLNTSLLPENTPRVLAHEKVHADEMKNYPGGCWPFFRRYNEDLEFRFAVEARAYCSAIVQFSGTEIVRDTILKLAVHLQEGYAANNTVEEVLKLLPCNNGVSVAPKDGTATNPP